MPSSIHSTLPLESESSASHVFFTTISELSRQGGIDFALNEPLPSPHIASFDWNNLVEPCLPSAAPFQIKVQVKHYTVAHCIVDEGASISILFAHAWRGMESHRLVPIVN